MRLFAAVALSVALCGGARAQTPSSINSKGEEVLLDMVARDKKGHPIRNLSQAEVSVYDNGVARPIQSFRLVQGRDAVSAGGAHTKLDPLRQIRLVTLIFEGLDNTSRRMARSAAMTLLEQDFQPNVYMSVFALGHRLDALQPFTNDRAVLRKAIEKATGESPSGFAGTNAELRLEAEQILGPDTSGKSIDQRLADGVALASQTSGQSAPDTGSLLNMLMAQTLLQIMRFGERSEDADTARADIFGLIAAVEGQYQLPGRKSILYFSPGFAIPQSAEEAFRSLISTANRYNVTFYPIDARGLLTTGSSDQSLAGLDRAAAGSRDNGQPQAIGDNHITTESALSMDTAIESGKLDTLGTLAILANQTGGFLVANTNDLVTPLRKISEEIDSYYEITYSPQIEKYDGSFRKISVRTTRADLKIQSRAGYFALPPSMTKSGPLDAFEMPLLRALSSTPLAQSFDFESTGLHYRSDGRNQTCEFVIDMPMSIVTMEADRKSGMYEGGVSYVALVKDENGEVIKKLRGDLPARINADQIEPFRRSRFTSTEFFDAPPGRYTLETAVLDRATGKTSARRSVIILPRPTAPLALSSVALIRQWGPKEADAPDEDPLVVGDKSATPTLTSTVTKSKSKSLPFYLVIYPDQNQTGSPSVRIEFSRNGKRQLASAPAVGTPDAQGRIQYVVSAPIEQLEPGNYEVRFIVTQGTEVAQEALALNLEP